MSKEINLDNIQGLIPAKSESKEKSSKEVEVTSKVEYDIDLENIMELLEAVKKSSKKTKTKKDTKQDQGKVEEGKVEEVKYPSQIIFSLSQDDRDEILKIVGKRGI